MGELYYFQKSCFFENTRSRVIFGIVIQRMIFRKKHRVFGSEKESDIVMIADTVLLLFLQLSFTPHTSHFIHLYNCPHVDSFSPPASLLYYRLIQVYNHHFHSRVKG